MSTSLPQLIVCAANRHKRTGKIILGVRHWDSFMRDQVDLLDKSGTQEAEWGSNWEQGFIDQKGNFLTREEAHKIATENNQIRRRCGGDKTELYSENLY